MWDALKLLGYIDCYHMFNLMIDPDDNDMWIDAINGKFFSHLGHKPFEKKDWDQLLGHCQVRLYHPQYIDPLLPQAPVK